MDLNSQWLFFQYFSLLLSNPKSITYNDPELTHTIVNYGTNTSFKVEKAEFPLLANLATGMFCNSLLREKEFNNEFLQKESTLYLLRQLRNDDKVYLEYAEGLGTIFLVF